MSARAVASVHATAPTTTPKGTAQLPTPTTRRFKKRFLVCFALALPVLYCSPLLHEWFGFTAITFPGSAFVAPALGILIFAYGGVPFLRMGAVEARNREPGTMLLISLAITVSFV